MYSFLLKYPLEVQYSFFKGERKLGEQQLEALQVTDEYGVHLTEITLEAESPLPLRQVKKEV